MKFLDNNLSWKQPSIKSFKKNFKCLTWNPSFIDCSKNKHFYVSIRTTKTLTEYYFCKSGIRRTGKLSPLPNSKTIGKLSNSKDISLSSPVVCSMSPIILTKCHKGDIAVIFILILQCSSSLWQAFTICVGHRSLSKAFRNLLPFIASSSSIPLPYHAGKMLHLL